MKIIRCKLLVFSLLTLFLAIGSLVAAEITEAEADAAVRQLWLDGYLKMSRSAQMAEQGKLFPAMQGYNEAMKLFETVHERSGFEKAVGRRTTDTTERGNQP